MLIGNGGGGGTGGRVCVRFGNEGREDGGVCGLGIFDCDGEGVEGVRVGVMVGDDGEGGAGDRV